MKVQLTDDSWTLADIQITMRIASTYEIESELTYDELKNKMIKSYEPEDTLKLDEFNRKYSDWPDFMRKGLRAISINNPNIHYTGQFCQGNFELKSYRYFYWRHITTYVRYWKKSSKLHIEFGLFWLTFVPIVLAIFFGLLVSIIDVESGGIVLSISLLLLMYQMKKVKNTLDYFKKYTS